MRGDPQGSLVTPVITFPDAPLSPSTMLTVDLAVMIGHLAIWYRSEARKNRNSDGAIFCTEKDDGTLVTEADKYCQYRFIFLNHRKDPLCFHFGEENLSDWPHFDKIAPWTILPTDYKTVVEEERCKVIDPINNTLYYSRGWMGWDVTAAELQRGQVHHGVVYSPQENQLLGVGERKTGTFVSHGDPIRLRPVVPKHWDGDLSHLVVGHGYSIPREARYRDFWNFLVDNGVETREIVSTSRGLLAACEEVDVYVHGFTYAWDMAGGMGLLLSCGRSVQLFRDSDNGPKPLSGLDAQSFNPNHEELCTEVMGGHPLAVEQLAVEWLRRVKKPKKTARRLRSMAAKV